MQDPSGKNGKKAYEAPRLEQYGDIRTITQAVDGGGETDGGTKASYMRTSF